MSSILPPFSSPKTSVNKPLLIIKIYYRVLHSKKIACKTLFNFQNPFKFMIDIFKISIMPNTGLDSGYIKKFRLKNGKIKE